MDAPGTSLHADSNFSRFLAHGGPVSAAVGPYGPWQGGSAASCQWDSWPSAVQVGVAAAPAPPYAWYWSGGPRHLQPMQHYFVPHPVGAPLIPGAPTAPGGAPACWPTASLANVAALSSFGLPSQSGAPLGGWAQPLQAVSAMSVSGLGSYPLPRGRTAPVAGRAPLPVASYNPLSAHKSALTAPVTTSTSATPLVNVDDGRHVGAATALTSASGPSMIAAAALSDHHLSKRSAIKTPGDSLVPPGPPSSLGPGPSILPLTRLDASGEREFYCRCVHSPDFRSSS